MLIWSFLTDTTPVWSSIWFKLPQTSSSKTSLQEIGTYPRGTTTSQLHNTLNTKHIQDFIHQLTAKFFAHCPSNPKFPQFNKSEITP